MDILGLFMPSGDIKRRKDEYFELIHLFGNIGVRKHGFLKLIHVFR
jgi:hypothetical protein